MGIDAQTLAEIHTQAGALRRTGPQTLCAWPGCTRPAVERANPKGEPGIFMCRQDAAIYREAGVR